MKEFVFPAVFLRANVHHICTKDWDLTCGKVWEGSSVIGRCREFVTCQESRLTISLISRNGRLTSPRLKTEWWILYWIMFLSVVICFTTLLVDSWQVLSYHTTYIILAVLSYYTTYIIIAVVLYIIFAVFYLILPSLGSSLNPDIWTDDRTFCKTASYWFLPPRTLLNPYY